MLGAIIGDIVGSQYEWRNNKSKSFTFSISAEDGERVFGMGNIDRTDDNRFGTIDIAQFQTNHIASDAHLDHLSHGAVGHVVIIGHEALHDGLWGSSPCAYPSLCRSIDCYSAEENKKCNNSFHSSLIICDI